MAHLIRADPDEPSVTAATGRSHAAYLRFVPLVPRMGADLP